MERTVIHEFEPIYNKDSRIIILGSFPSVVSRESNFYYSHPRNRFWPLMARLLESSPVETVEDKKELLLSHGIALYDACIKAQIVGSMDKDLKVEQLADLEPILQTGHIQKIFCNGQKAYDLTTKQLDQAAIKLPSTSPANARYRMDDLVKEWQQILAYL
ncbi:DNA-deoxyinosine glycosylase [Dolosicoccus paucivorans]